jgi:hypothetical protein
VCLSFAGSVEAVRRTVGRPCHHLPIGVDVLRFTPFPHRPARSIDVYAMGRRVEWLHRALLREAAKGELFYVYDTVPSAFIQPRDHVEHRDLVASFAKRSRSFVTFPAKVDHKDETRGQSELGTRFFEGAAAGAVLIGEAPTGPAFRAEFDWPDSLIEVTDERALLEWLERCRRQPEQIEAIGIRNAVEALRRHDWLQRWARILELSGLEPTERWIQRKRRLEELAAAAVSKPAFTNLEQKSLA